MAQIRMYRVHYETKTEDGYISIKANNKIDAFNKACKIGVRGVKDAKFKSVEFMRWVSK